MSNLHKRSNAPASDDYSHSSRRAFLKASGFALFVSALEGCGRPPVQRAPVQMAISPVEQLEDAVPGKSNYYASVCGACTAACGVLIKNRDGRPIKLEGNPDHPISKGGLCAVGQASVLSLYDSNRWKKPQAVAKAGSADQASDWKTVDTAVIAELNAIRNRGGNVRFLTETLVSPTRKAAIEQFLSNYPDSELITYDPLSCAAILDAHQQTHAARVLPRYRFDRADVIVSFGADFLGTWISPVEFTAAYRDGRVPVEKPSVDEESVVVESPATMSYHLQFESGMSLTGSNADRRVVVLPGEIGLILSHLAQRIAKKPFALTTAPTPGIDVVLAESTNDAHELDRLADRLWQARGKSLIVCGSQDLNVQIVCNYLNEMLGSYGNTLDIVHPSMQREGSDNRLTILLQELAEGKVDALFVSGVNPVYDLPGGELLSDHLKQVPLLVSFSGHQSDETAALADYVCPEGHWLEQWTDAQPVAGTLSIGQPGIRPLGDTRSLLTSLATWLGTPKSDREIVQDYWKKEIIPRQKSNLSPQEFWDISLHAGFVELEPEAGPLLGSPSMADLRLITTATETGAEAGAVEGAFTLLLYPKMGLLDGRHAQNPWLQELPDPITKATWDNYACIGPATAKQLDLRDGDFLRIEVADENPQPDAKTKSLELPVLIQPGQHEQSVSVALGYGRKGTDRFAKIGPQWIESQLTTGANGLVGTNVAPWLRLESGQLRYHRSGATLTKIAGRSLLARTQKYQDISVPKKLQLPGGKRRPNVEETTLAAYRKDPTSGHHAHPESEELWPDDHPYKGHHWGLIIDMNKCTGCSACVIGCQAENNVPVVGKDEIRRSRDMHWIRLDRYYSQEDEHDPVDVLYQPMMCQQCDHAPCETVCPVIATAHSDEGLNQQVYNRCVGTRYCANNCPYKVRRFNWFNYAHPDDQENLVLNPDVTVRTRGVMEKCSFCVQRIQEAKLEAKRLGLPLVDGDVKPACQQSCPAGAIVFGDLNDPESQVAKASESPRCYQVLSELNVRPTVGYLRVVRNRDDGTSQTAEERTGHHG